MPTITVNDAEFYYELHGEGPALVLISGYASDHAFWTSMLGQFSQHFQVLMFDNRAVGRTTDDYRELSTASMADDAMAIADALGLENPHVIGHSMGGSIAQQVGIRHGDKINKLILAATSAKWHEATLQCISSNIELQKQNVDIQLILDILAPWLLGERELTDPKKMHLFKQAILENPHPQSIANQERQLHALTTHDTRTELGTITAKTLVVFGTDDKLASQRNAEYLADSINGSHMLGIDCGHSFPLCAPYNFPAACISFLREPR